MIAAKARRRIFALAWCIAVETPTKQGKYSAAARVDWKIVHELREHFTTLGYDLAKARALISKNKKPSH